MEDLVLLLKLKLIFENGYSINWSENVFVVIKCMKRETAVYRIKNLLGQKANGTFYAELFKISAFRRRIYNRKEYRA